MISEAIKTVEDLAKRANAQTVVLDGVTYYTVPLIQPKPSPEPTAAPLILHSLDGIRSLLESTASDEGARGEYLVHVSGPCEVCIVSELFGANRQRETLAKAEPVLKAFDFGQYHELEWFVIALQSRFVQDDTTAKILKLVGNIKDEKVNTASDDGVSQSVVAKVGIARQENVAVPNPVTLAPFRTFPEVEQPASKFVLRLKSGIKESELPTVALFEADGGAWRGAAISNVAAWLRKALPETVRVIG